MAPNALTRSAATQLPASPGQRRTCVAVLLLLFTGVCTAYCATPQDHPAATSRSGPPAPIVRAAPQASPNNAPSNNAPGSRQTRTPQQQPHIAQWMAAHRSLSPAEQQNALAAEPGFSKLTPAVQQRMHERLSQLNEMPPDQRQRVIDRTEAMERLTPPQRQEVRGALKALGALPEDRRRAVARAFRAVRDLPEAQRQTYLGLPLIRGQFSDAERLTLNNLIQVAPYLPPPAPAPTGQAPR